MFGDPAKQLVCREHLRSGMFARVSIGLQSTLAPQNVGARKWRQQNSGLGMPQADWTAEYIGVGECRLAHMAATEFLFGDTSKPIGLQSRLALENVGARKSRQHNSCLGMPQADWFAMYVGAGECRRAQLAAAEFVFRGASNRLACRVHRRWRMSARASGGSRVFVWGCFKPIGAQNTLLA